MRIAKDKIAELEKWEDQIERDRSYSARQFDKLIITLSGGGLIFTSGLTSYSEELRNSEYFVLIILSWCLFTATLIINLFSQLTSQNANVAEIKKTQKEIINLKNIPLGGLPITESNEDYEKIGRKFNKITQYLNLLSIGTLIIAIVLYIIFIAL